MWLFSLMLALPTVVIVAITSPVQRQIFQRNGSNQCVIPITGTYSGGSADTLQAAVSNLAPYPGTSTSFSTIVGSPSGGTYSSTLNVAPGWYTLTVRALTTTMPAGEVSVVRVGCGELFIAAGQSNSANDGAAAQNVTYDNESKVSLAGAWSIGNDPQPSASGSLGSTWPAFADALSNYLQMPVGILSVGVTSTTVANWVSTYYASNLKPAILLLGSFRAILWHQGESDSTSTTTQSAYQTSLRSLVTSSRSDAGFTVPWGIATATYDAGVPANAAPIAAAQAAVVADANNFAGANSDSFTSATYRQGDGVHLTATGLQVVGNDWYAKVKTAFVW